MSIDIQEYKSLIPYCTLKVGGSARFLVHVDSIEKMQEAFLFSFKKGLPFCLIGKGSNTLFDDQGFEGLVIVNKIQHLTRSETHLNVGSAYSYMRLAQESAKMGLLGLEFAIGIPGSVGGAIYMNAGAEGVQTEDVLESIDFLTAKGEFKSYSKKEGGFSYRSSIFQRLQGAIVGAVFSLKRGQGGRDTQKKLLEKRKSTQPWTDKTAGCAFQNLQHISAGALIEKCGLKGFQLGGAKVSEKHANFIVNTGSASARDVLHLMDHIEKTVFLKTGHRLEREVCHISSKKG